MSTSNRKAPTDATRLEYSAVRWLLHYATEEEARARVADIHSWASEAQLDMAFGAARLGIQRGKDLTAKLLALKRIRDAT